MEGKRMKKLFYKLFGWYPLCLGAWYIVGEQPIIGFYFIAFLLLLSLILSVFEFRGYLKSFSKFSEFDPYFVNERIYFSTKERWWEDKRYVCYNHGNGIIRYSTGTYSFFSPFRYLDPFAILIRYYTMKKIHEKLKDYVYEKDSE